MIAGTALRHQMLLPEQQALFDYWRSKCRGGRLPRREDIDPKDISPFLPMVSLLEVCPGEATNRYKYRLAGTGFWDLYNTEITGRYLDELPIGCRVQYWNRVLARVSTSGRASAGVTRPGTPNKGHLAQFWVRLPLSCDGENTTLILGFDHLAKVSERQDANQVKEQISA